MYTNKRIAICSDIYYSLHFKVVTYGDTVTFTQYTDSDIRTCMVMSTLHAIIVAAARALKRTQLMTDRLLKACCSLKHIQDKALRNEDNGKQAHRFSVQLS